MRASTRVLDDGKATIPKPVREHLNLEKGDFIHIDVSRVDDVPESDETDPNTAETTADD